VNVFIAGGTGFIGTALTGMLLRQGHQVTVLTRKPAESFTRRDRLTFISGDATIPGIWQKSLAGQDAVVNLAGMSIFRRWTKNNRRKIFISRTVTTSNIVQAIQERNQNRITMISVSGVGYYGHRGDEFIEEDSPPGSDFLAQLAVAWEEEAMKARDSGARVVICRLGHVQGIDGGMVPRLASLSKWCLGGRWGNGQQWLSWIHKRDLIQALLFLMNNPDIEGAVNVCSPNPVRNREMMEIYSGILRVRTQIPQIPGSLLRVMFGEFADAFLNGQRVVPSVLVNRGFHFSFPVLKDALSDLLIFDE
jgi:uncharacterized protein (TIGR01777 family)